MFLEKIKSFILSIFRNISLYRKFTSIPKGSIHLANLKNDINFHYLKDNDESAYLLRILEESEMPIAFKKFITSITFYNFVLSARSWTVWGNQGAVITSDEYLFADVSREFSNEVHSIFKQVCLKKALYKKGSGTVIAASGSHIYYHWMFDVIPRINELKKANVYNAIDWFVINYENKTFQDELLSKLSIPKSKILISNNHWNFHYRFEKLYVPSLPSSVNVPSLESCLYLKTLFKENIDNEIHNRRFYIRRTGHRKIENEIAVMEILHKFNIEVISPEYLSVGEQASLFSMAELVIGPHGGGFTNIVFCKPNTHIIDLFSPEWINPCYWVIATHLKLDYHYLVGENTNKNYFDTKQANILINMSKLRRMINEILPNG